MAFRKKFPFFFSYRAAFLQLEIYDFDSSRSLKCDVVHLVFAMCRQSVMLQIDYDGLWMLDYHHNVLSSLKSRCTVKSSSRSFVV